MKINIVSFSVIYIIISILICNFVQLSEVIKAIVITPNLLFIPLAIGNAIYPFNNFSTKVYFDTISSGLIYWCTGIIFITLLILILDTGNSLNSKLIISVVLVVILFSIIKSYIADTKKIILSYRICHILIPFVVGLVFVIFIDHFSPYPLNYGGDIHRHVQIGLMLSEDNYLLLPPPYLPSISILLSIIANLFNAPRELYTIAWMSRYIFYIMYSTGLYIFSHQISQRKDIALLTSIIGMSIMYVSHNVVDSFIYLYHFSPKVIVFLIIPYLFYFVHKNILVYQAKHAKNILTANIFLTIFTLLLFLLINNLLKLHNLIGIYLFMFIIFAVVFLLKSPFISTIDKDIRFNYTALFILMSCILFISAAIGIITNIIIIFYITIYYISLVNPKIRYVNIFFFLAVIVFILSQKFGIISFSALQVYNIPIKESFSVFDNNWNLFHSLYSLIIIVMFCLGLIFLCKSSSTFITIFFTTNLLIFIYFTPISFIYRILAILNPLIAYISSNTVYELIKNKNKRISIIYIVLILCIMFSSYFSTSIENIGTSTKGEYYTQYTHDEYEVSKWIRDNTDTNTFVVTDVQTQYVIGGISNRRIAYSLNGNNELNKILRINIHSILSSTDPRETYMKINNVLNDKNYTCYQYGIIPERCKKQNCEHLNAIVVMNKNRMHLYGIKNDVEFEKAIVKYYNLTYFEPMFSINESIFVFRVKNGVK